MISSHRPVVPAWTREEGYRFADRVMAGKLPFVYPVSEPNSFGNISFPVEIPEDFEQVSARVVYLKKPFQYSPNNELFNSYDTADASIENGVVSATVPKAACCYYLEFTATLEGKRIVSSTALVTKT